MDGIKIIPSCYLTTYWKKQVCKQIHPNSKVIQKQLEARKRLLIMAAGCEHFYGFIWGKMDESTFKNGYPWRHFLPLTYPS